ncbi:MAG TPA: zf-HC2 domain-containing protein [Pyrinomonadaceae bacterium]
MANGNEKFIDCTAFEEALSDYLERTLDSVTHKAVAAHALACPLCHSLMNDVKEAMKACHQLAEPRLPVSRLEAGILARTVPDSTINCSEFEEHLTDYLDGFLPASVFHRWERHALLCEECTDLPGIVVRSLAAIVNYKLDELPVPAGLHQRILNLTLGTELAKQVKPSLASRFGEWARGLSFPISVPQLAPVAGMLLVAFLAFSQTVSADGSIAGVYAQGVQIAEETYRQGTDVLNGARGKSTQNGTTEVDNK